jgi:hypothetical protein
MMEYGQSAIMEANAASHSLNAKGKGNNNYGMQLERPLSTDSLRSNLSESTPLLLPSIMESFVSAQDRDQVVPYDPRNTLRFQVVVWYIGQIDMIQGRVPVTFRVTLFWNAPDDVPAPSMDHNTNMSDNASSVDDFSSTTSKTEWKMHGRQEAFQKELKENPLQTVDVPPVSILNVVTFETIGQPEVSLLNESEKLMRWTCMYRATLIQDHWRVDDFPHDEHTLVIKLAVLAHRKRGERWDHGVYKLDLATREDSQGSTRIPHGLVVDEVAIPEFRYSKEDGLAFELASLRHGPGGGIGYNTDKCLHVSLRIMRDSTYYDKNIMPLLGLLNFVAVSITVALPAEDVFQRGLLMLNIAFVEIGIRMTTDSRLPSVFYQIKMQRILNEYFAVLLLLVLESMMVFELFTYDGFRFTGYIDALAALTALSHNAWTLISYYGAAKNVRMKVLHMSSSTRALSEPQPSSQSQLSYR